jgi:hypothetical protein
MSVKFFRALEVFKADLVEMAAAVFGGVGLEGAFGFVGRQVIRGGC